MLFTFILTPSVWSFDPFTIGSAIAAAGGIIIEKLADNTVCKFKDCCNSREIPADFESKLNIIDFLTLFLS